MPTCGPLLILPPPSEAVGTPGGRGYVATLPTCGPLLILPPARKRWGPPKRQGLCSHLAHLWATSDSAPRSEAVGTSSGRGYVATLPTCGPLLILPPARKRWGPPRRQGLCSHLAHLWATSDSAPPSEAVGTPSGRGYVATLPTCGPLLILPPARKRWGPPWRQGLCSHLAHLWATSDSAPRSEAVGTPGGRGYVATLPTCGPLLILRLAVKRWGPPRRQGLCSHLAHLWATSDSAPRSEAVGTPQAAGVM